MEYAVKFAAIKSWTETELVSINQIRLFKQSYLPCKLVRMNGREQTKCFNEINKKSYLEWHYN